MPTFVPHFVDFLGRCVKGVRQQDPTRSHLFWRVFTGSLKGVSRQWECPTLILVCILATVALGLGAPMVAAQDAPDPWAAAIVGDLNAPQRTSEAGGSPDVREPNGSTPLILTAMFG